MRRINALSNRSPAPKIPITFGTCSENGNELGRPIEPKALITLQQKRPTFAKAIFVTRLDPHLTPEKVLNYIKSKGVDANESSIECRKLVKLNQDLNELSFCSFKLSTNDELYQTLINPSFWPPSVGIRDFVAVNTTGKRPASNLSPIASQLVFDSGTAQQHKQLRSDLAATPSSGNRPKSTPVQQKNSSNVDIRNFCRSVV